MRIAFFALVALASGAYGLAGTLNPIPGVPDAGSSVLLLGMGLGGIALARRAFWR